MAFWKRHAGQSNLEVIIALALMVMMIGALFSLYSAISRASSLAQQRTRALALLSDGIEANRQIRNAGGFSALTAGTHGLALNGTTWAYTGTSDVTDGYTRITTVNAINTAERDITVTVSWTSLFGQAEQVSTTTRLTDWGAVPVPPSASNCAPAGSATGDWSHPVSLGSADIGSGNQGTDVVAVSPYVLVSGTASSSSKPDLFVFNVSNPSDPELSKSIDIGSNGISALSLNGTHVYGASGNDSKELLVFDVSTPASTTLAGSVDISGTTDALTVLSANSWVAVGRKSNSSSEILLYSIATPASPTYITGFEAGADVNDFAFDGSYLYAATSAPTKDVIVIDMRNPSNPSLLSTFDISMTGAAMSAAFHYPSTLLVGGQDGNIYALDASNPSALKSLSSFSTGGTVEELLCIVDSLAFAGTANSNQEFQIFNASNPSNLTLYTSLNFPQMATGIDFANNDVFISVRSNDALRVLTSSP